MTEKYNLNQLRGAYGAGYYAGKKAEEKVTLTFEEVRLLCGGAVDGRDMEGYKNTCGLFYDENGLRSECKSENCPYWIGWKKEGKIT